MTRRRQRLQVSHPGSKGEPRPAEHAGRAKTQGHSLPRPAATPDAPRAAPRRNGAAGLPGPLLKEGELADRMDCFTNIVVDEVGVDGNGSSRPFTSSGDDLSPRVDHVARNPHPRDARGSVDPHDHPTQVVPHAPETGEQRVMGTRRGGTNTASKATVPDRRPRAPRSVWSSSTTTRSTPPSTTRTERAANTERSASASTSSGANNTRSGVRAVAARPAVAGWGVQL